MGWDPLEVDRVTGLPQGQKGRPDFSPQGRRLRLGAALQQPQGRLGVCADGDLLLFCDYIQGGADKLGQNSFFSYGFVYGRIWLKFCKNINKIITYRVPMNLVQISVQKS